MASPTNIAITNSYATDVRMNITMNATVPASGTTKAVCRFTPTIYSSFVFTVDSDSSLLHSNNPTHSFSLLYNNFPSAFMRGISYNLDIALKTDGVINTDFASYGSNPVKVNIRRVVGTRPFSIGTVAIPSNRIGESIFSTDQIEYPGTWTSFPRITLTGRFNYCRLVNTATGASVGMEGTVASGEYRVLETDVRKDDYGWYGGADLDDLEDRIYELEDDSDIRNFVLRPQNELVRPMAIEVYVFHRDGSTSCRVEYPVRYYGL